MKVPPVGEARGGEGWGVWLTKDIQHCTDANALGACLSEPEVLRTILM